MIFYKQLIIITVLLSNCFELQSCTNISTINACNLANDSSINKSNELEYRKYTNMHIAHETQLNIYSANNCQQKCKKINTHNDSYNNRNIAINKENEHPYIITISDRKQKITPNKNINNTMKVLRNGKILSLVNNIKFNGSKILSINLDCNRQKDITEVLLKFDLSENSNKSIKFDNINLNNISKLNLIFNNNHSSFKKCYIGNITTNKDVDIVTNITTIINNND